MTAEWGICSQGIRLNAIQGGTTNALESIMEKTFPIKQMIQIMRSVSADVFPDDDAFYYVDGANEKNAVMEFHLYNCIGTMCKAQFFHISFLSLYIFFICFIIRYSQNT